VTSVGWHTAIHSHKLEKISNLQPKPCPATAKEVCDTSLAQRAEQLMKENLQPAESGKPTVTVWLDPKMKNGQGGSGMLEAYHLVRTPGARNQTPYWIFPVPKFVVYNHTDVWNPNFIGLVTAIHNASREPKHEPAGARPKSKSSEKQEMNEKLQDIQKLLPIAKGQLFALPPQ